MGNSPSSTGKRSKLMKELDQFTKPTGLYPTCAWDGRAVRKMILDGKIAPRFPGTDIKYQGTEECPICFMRYCAVNRTSCCQKPICSECYLQVQQPKGTSPCPYCNREKYKPQYALPDEAKMMEKEMFAIALHLKIMEASEKGEPLIPLVDSPNDAPDTHLTAQQVYANVPLASVQDRQVIEEEIRKQHDFETESPTRVRRGSGGRRPLNRRERHEEMDLRRAILDSLGVPRELHQVEELMLLEGIRQSIEEQSKASGQTNSSDTTGGENQTSSSTSTSTSNNNTTPEPNRQQQAGGQSVPHQEQPPPPTGNASTPQSSSSS